MFVNKTSPHTLLSVSNQTYLEDILKIIPSSLKHEVHSTVQSTQIKGKNENLDVVYPGYAKLSAMKIKYKRSVSNQNKIILPALKEDIRPDPSLLANLRNTGVTPDVQDKNGFTAIMLSVIEKKPLDFTGNILNKYQPNLNLMNCRGDTALHIAVRTKEYGMAFLLIDYGANGHIKNHNCQTPLMLAMMDNNEVLIKKLQKTPAFNHTNNEYCKLSATSPEKINTDENNKIDVPKEHLYRPDQGINNAFSHQIVDTRSGIDRSVVANEPKIETQRQRSALIMNAVQSVVVIKPRPEDAYVVSRACGSSPISMATMTLLMRIFYMIRQVILR